MRSHLTIAPSQVPGFPWYILTFTKNQVFTNYLQALRPAIYRCKDSANVWRIHSNLLNKTHTYAINKKLFTTIEIIQEEVSLDDYKELHLQPTAPPEIVKASYKILAQKHHPDHGGDSGQMIRLNLAYGRIIKSRDK